MGVVAAKNSLVSHKFNSVCKKTWLRERGAYSGECMPQWPGNTAHGIVAAAILSLGGIGLCLLGGMPSAKSAELTPAQTVAYRFPANWGSLGQRLPTAAGQAAGAPRAVASLMFDPTPTYGLASASSTPVTLPERANAYADPSTDGAAEGKRGAASGEDRAGKPRPAKTISNVLNDAQIASIKARLRLTPEQERHWPEVEAALRSITYSKDGSHKGKLATVDPNSPAVQQLKTVAMPLLASFSDEQKNQVRLLARLMGLEQVAQAF